MSLIFVFFPLFTDRFGKLSQQVQEVKKTSRRRDNVQTTSLQRHVLAGYSYKSMNILTKKPNQQPAI